MEPERPIEKLLRVFAKKRRDQAGAPLEMSPVTRRLLQGEVARRASKGGKESVFLMLVAWLRRRTAFALGVAAVVGIGVWWLQSLTGTRTSEMRMAQTSDSISADEREVSPAETPAPELKRESDQVSGRDAGLQSEKLGREIAGNKLKEQDTPVATAPFNELSDATAQTGVMTRSDSNLGATVAVAGNLAELSKMTNATLAEESLVARESRMTNFSLDVAAVSIAQAPGSSVNRSVADRTSVRYYQVRDQTKDFDATVRRQRLAGGGGSGAVSNPAVVLDSFAVEQRGREMRIVDGDGSVYSGFVDLGNGLGFAAAAPAAPVPAQGLEDKKAVGQTAPEYHFLVSGTNQSLNQKLVFTGTFFALTNEAGLGAGGGGGGALPNLPASTPHIRGTVRMGDATEIEIQAAPAPTRP